MLPAEAPELPPGFQLVDRRGLVADVRPAVPVGVSGPRIEPVGDGTAYLVSWTGGVCDEETVLTVTRSGADVELSLDVSLAVLAPGDACQRRDPPDHPADLRQAVGITTGWSQRPRIGSR